MSKLRENVGLTSTMIAICSGLSTLYTFIEREQGRINLWKIFLLMTCIFVIVAVALLFYKSISALVRKTFNIGVVEQRPEDKAIAEESLRNFAKRLDDIKEKHK